MPIDAIRFRQTMGQLVSGVVVVSVLDPEGRALGMTASSVTSLSLEPPLVLVCVDRQAEIHDAVVRSPRFGLSVLGSGQEALAVRFAQRGGPHFDGLDVGLFPGGLPKLKGAIASLECRRDALHAAGDHTIVTGVVEWAETADGAPLCYFRSRYAELAP
jgi:flavin reductase (DIM6/NTAB) family NADH-FMN oxidoreductase RutF